MSPAAETGITAGKNTWKEKAIDLYSSIYIAKISENAIPGRLTFSMLFSTTVMTGKFSCHLVTKKRRSVLLL